jgi:hypothetical protein
MIRGWVYILTNKAMPGLVKVGFSTKDPSLRASELEGTGLPHPFVVAYDVLVLEPRDVEQQTHAGLKDAREAKEFFRVSVSEAVAAVRAAISGQNKTVLLETVCEALLPVVAQPAATPLRESLSPIILEMERCRTRTPSLQSVIPAMTVHSCAMYGVYGCTNVAEPGSEYCRRHSQSIVKPIG